MRYFTKQECVILQYLYSLPPMKNKMSVKIVKIAFKNHEKHRQFNFTDRLLIIVLCSNKSNNNCLTMVKDFTLSMFTDNDSILNKTNILRNFVSFSF